MYLMYPMYYNVVRYLTAASAACLLATAAQAQGGKATVVTLVSSTVNPPSISNIYYLAAMDSAFKKRGLDVQLQQSSGSPSSLAAIVSGRAEFASIAVTTLANAAAEGIKAKMVVTGNFDFPGMILSGPEIKTVKDLEGKRMGATAIGSMEYTIARSYLKKQGVDISKLDWVATRQTSNTIQALGSGQIAAAWIVMSSAVTALQLHPNLKILVDAETLAKVNPNPGGAVVVTERFAAQNGAIVEAMVGAVIEANRALYNDRAFFEAIVEKWFPDIYNVEQKKLLYDAYRPSWGVNGGLPLGVMRAALENWKTDVNPDRAINPNFSKVEDLMDTRYAAKTLAELGVIKDALDTAEWMTGAR
jgi:ABC-type nitrate/sulfonate/bicarbonate transport system substrate-binding protein